MCSQATSAALEQAQQELQAKEQQVQQAQQELQAKEQQVRELELDSQKRVANLLAEREAMLQTVEQELSREISAKLLREREADARARQASAALCNKELAVSMLAAQLERNQETMKAMSEQTAAAQGEKEEAVRLAKQSVADQLNEHLENEKQKLQIQLNEARCERETALVEERTYNHLVGENQDMKEALSALEKKLLGPEGLGNAPILKTLHEGDSPDRPPLPDDQQPSDYCIREFGQLAAHEAAAAGIDIQTDFEYMGWTSFPQRKDQKETPVTESCLMQDGTCIGFREKEEVVEGLEHEIKDEGGNVIRKIRAPNTKKKATMWKRVARKYDKETAEKVLEALKKMHNDYLHNPGTGYSMSRKLWHRKKNRELTWQEKTTLFFQLQM